ncbi:hypothetical protein WJX73_009560 [Symbiochloris irregularis]|uniref:Bidirectional sugar transporter SWEET n=1 Tax=Symbiochloris irregularis TaxID=706552 RepID=A0AAW1NY77_9CHLO
MALSGAGLVLLTYVFPAIGCVVSLLTFSSSVAAVLQVRRKRSIGQLNPVPYPAILAQTTGQVVYGSVIGNWFIFWANAPGLLLGIWLTLSTIPFAAPRVQNIMTACVMLLAIYIATLALVTTHIDAPHHTKATIWGAAGTVALVLYYTAPLSTLIKVVRKRDSSSLHPPLCIMNVVNVVCWLSYGVAIKNPFIWGPETGGAVLSISALALLLIYPRKEIVLERSRLQADGNAASSAGLPRHSDYDSLRDEHSIHG